MRKRRHANLVFTPIMFMVLLVLILMHAQRVVGLLLLSLLLLLSILLLLLLLLWELVCMVCWVLSNLLLLPHTHTDIDVSADVVVERLLVGAGRRLKRMMHVVMFEPVLVRAVCSFRSGGRCELWHIQWLRLLLLLLPLVFEGWHKLVLVRLLVVKLLHTLLLLELYRGRLRELLGRGRLVVGERRRQKIKRR